MEAGGIPIHRLYPQGGKPLAPPPSVETNEEGEALSEEEAAVLRSQRFQERLEQEFGGQTAPTIDSGGVRVPNPAATYTPSLPELPLNEMVDREVDLLTAEVEATADKLATLRDRLARFVKLQQQLKAAPGITIRNGRLEIVPVPDR